MKQTYTIILSVVLLQACGHANMYDTADSDSADTGIEHITSSERVVPHIIPPGPGYLHPNHHRGVHPDPDRKCAQGIPTQATIQSYHTYEDVEHCITNQSSWLKI